MPLWPFVRAPETKTLGFFYQFLGSYPRSQGVTAWKNLLLPSIVDKVITVFVCDYVFFFNMSIQLDHYGDLCMHKNLQLMLNLISQFFTVEFKQCFITQSFYSCSQLLMLQSLLHHCDWLLNTIKLIEVILLPNAIMLRYDAYYDVSWDVISPKGLFFMIH